MAASTPFSLDDGQSPTLIDMLYDTDGHRVLEELASMGRTVSDIDNIILTHGHRSHLGGARALKEQSGARISA